MAEQRTQAHVGDWREAAQMPQLVAEMRDWLEDCGADTSGRSAGDIAREVELQHAGGVNGFIDAGELVEAVASVGPSSNRRWEQQGQRHTIRAGETELERGRRLALTMGRVAMLLQQARQLAAGGWHDGGVVSSHGVRLYDLLARAQIDVTGLRLRLSEDVPGVGIVDPVRPDDQSEQRGDEHGESDSGERCTQCSDLVERGSLIECDICGQSVCGACAEGEGCLAAQS